MLALRTDLLHEAVQVESDAGHQAEIFQHGVKHIEQQHRREHDSEHCPDAQQHAVNEHAFQPPGHPDGVGESAQMRHQPRDAFFQKRRRFVGADGGEPKDAAENSKGQRDAEPTMSEQVVQNLRPIGDDQ
jgi:hypothetical protein